jgi:hypothetical protein
MGSVQRQNYLRHGTPRLKLGNSFHKRELHDASVGAVPVEWCQHTSMHGVSYASDVEHFRHWEINHLVVASTRLCVSCL